MEEYITVKEKADGSYEEKHSKFLATVYPCKSEEEAAKIISAHKSRFWDAKHNVYAYVLRDKTARFSDDGEPHGTAGKPILDIINANGITDCLVVVTRYFGGILLGTGGLVRAYTNALKDALGNAELAVMTECSEYTLTLSYNLSDKITDMLKRNGAVILDTKYSDSVTLNFAVFDEKEDEILKQTGLISSGSAAPVKKGKKILPKDIKK